MKKNLGIDWNPDDVGKEFAEQVVFVGIYDGHGGQAVSLFLHQNLHGIFESVDAAQIPEVFAWTKEHGGYFRRYRGGVLQPWLKHPPSKQKMDLEVRATLAFLEVRIVSGIIPILLVLDAFGWRRRIDCYTKQRSVVQPLPSRFSTLSMSPQRLSLLLRRSRLLSLMSGNSSPEASSRAYH